MNIAVYLASSFGTDKRIQEETKKLGEWIGTNKHSLIYGGSKAGLMEVIAQSCKDKGGKVIGVETKLFYNQGQAYPLCDDFYLTETLSQRKKIMMDISDAFIALPGGVGTLDEISEILCLNKLSEKKRPILFLNINHFYDDLQHQFEKMIAYQYLTKEDISTVYFVDSTDELPALLEGK